MNRGEGRPWVLITGSSGFLAEAIREQLESEFEVVGLDRLAGPGTQVVLDLSVTDRLRIWWKEQAPRLDNLRAILFCAAYYDFRNRSDSRYQKVERGLECLLELFAEQAPARASFVFASSMAALRPTEPGIKLTAEAPKRGGWEYPRSKLRCEAILEKFKGSRPIVELVLAGVYSDAIELVPLYFLIRALAERRLERMFYPAPPDRGLTYLHRSDAARAFRLALNLGPGHHRVLIGERTATTYRQIRTATLSAFLNRSESPLFRVPRWVAASGAWAIAQYDSTTFFQPWMMAFAGEHFEFDLDATERKLGWEPTRYLGDLLPRLLLQAKQDYPNWVLLNQKRPR